MRHCIFTSLFKPMCSREDADFLVMSIFCTTHCNGLLIIRFCVAGVFHDYNNNTKKKFVSFCPSFKDCIVYILHISQPQIQLVLTKSLLIIISSKWHHGGTRKWSYDRNLKKRVSKIWRQTKVSKLLVCHNWCQQCSLCWWSQSQELTPEKVF